MLDGGLINTSIDRASHTVLVVDDDPSTRYTTARVLRAAGFQTVEAATGAEALARAPEVSAVVLDVQLPDINGFEVCRQMRARPDTAKLPVMHLSAAYIRNEDQVIGLDSGADAYLIHPVEPAVLIATLQALIRARMAEDEVRRSETRFRAIYSNAQSGIALIDALGRFADVNPAMEQLLARSREELLGRAISEFAPPQWLKEVQAQTLGNTGKQAHGNDTDGTGDADSPGPAGNAAWECEFPLLTGTGQWVYLNWHMSSHIEPGLRVGIALDVTERTLLDQRRQELLEREQAARQVAEQHGRTKDDFISVLSHELRTPLNTIQGWVAILKRRGGTPELAKALDVIDRNVRTQARMVSDILDVSRINSGKLQLDRDWSNPAQLVADCVASLQASADAKQLVIHQRTEQARRAWMDGQRFEQICRNLLTNAIKFSRAGGEITITLALHGDRLRLAVSDQGQGIEPAFMAQMFERFTQGDTPGNRTHGGLGLGLSIVKHLSELHGGTVSAQSPGLGQGATLTVELQVAPPTVAAASEGAAGTAAAAAAAAAVAAARGAQGLDADDAQLLQAIHILIVEDDADAQEVMSVVLGERNATVRVAHDFDSALAALGEAWPDILVCDIGLPGKDGYEVARQVRALEQERGRAPLPCIALTAFARPEDEAKALSAGFNMHISKPLCADELLAAVLRLAGKKE